MLRRGSGYLKMAKVDSMMIKKMGHGDNLPYI